MESVSLPLDQPRIVAIKHKEKRFTYRFRRITASDWKQYYRGITNQTEVSNGEQVRTMDFRTALQALVESALEKVDGYTGPGGVSVDQLKEWKTKLPVGHKIAVGLVLTDVSVDAAEQEKDVSVITDLTEISLRAKWSAEDDGTMSEYSGLIHRFNHPSIEQLRRFNRESSRARVVGGSRTGKTIWPGHQELLAEFYDQLIASVDGYRVGTLELGQQADEIKQHMDTQHKVAAARALFTGGDEAEVESKSEESE